MTIERKTMTQPKIHKCRNCTLNYYCDHGDGCQIPFDYTCAVCESSQKEPA